MNQAILVTEVVANEGQTCAFKGLSGTMGVARRLSGGDWQLKLADGSQHRCEDFDAMRQMIRQLTPAGACFERRRICARHHPHGRLAA